MPRIFSRDQRREGATLYVVIVLLTLFLVVGMCALLYSESQATSARIFREATTYRDKYPTPEELMGYSLGALIYDAADDPQGVLSAARGHSLARTMYGWNYDIPGSNSTPFSGAGALHTPVTNLLGVNAQDYELINRIYWKADDAVPGVPTPLKPERFYDKPKNQYLYTGGANVPYTYPDMNHVYLAAMNSQDQMMAKSFWRDPNNQFDLDTKNQSYADLSANPRVASWFLPDAADKTLKYRSMRPRPADQLFAGELAALQGNSLQQAQTIQRMAQQGIIFPPPGDGGDVRNRPGTPKPGEPTNDSVWVDLGYPPVRLQYTNRMVKPLFAFLIVELDGRVNLNTAGNVREKGGDPMAPEYQFHGSNQGWGRWEVNPRKLVTVPNPLTDDAEYLNLFRGDAQNVGRYGQVPGALPPFLPGSNFPTPDRSGGSAATPNSTIRPYARVDFDGSVQEPPGTMPPGQPPYRYQLPQQPSAPTSPLYPFPTFTNRFRDGDPFERNNHPSVFNPFQLNFGVSGSGNKATNDQNLPISDLKYLINWNPAYGYFGPVPGDVLNSHLGKLMPNTFRNNPKFYKLITPYSMDLDRMGAAPGQAGPMPDNGLFGVKGYELDPNTPPHLRYPTSNGTGFGPFVALRPQAPQPGGDYRDNDWRSVLPDWGRVDLNRPLRPFPPPVAPGRRYTWDPVNQIHDPNAPQMQLATYALMDRLYLAKDILNRLIVATGAEGVDPLSPYVTPGNPQFDQKRFEAVRYLAQLAVNMVDYLDDDDVITPLNWLVDPLIQVGGAPAAAKDGWVFGTEIPRLVVNEVYAQVQNHPEDTFGKNLPFVAGSQSDPDTMPPYGPNHNPFPTPQSDTAKATRPYRINFFVELHNPHPQDPNLPDQGAARLQLAEPNLPPGQRNVYQLVIRSQVSSQTMRSTANLTGDPQSSGMPQPHIDLVVSEWDADPAAPASQTPQPAPDQAHYLVKPASGAYSVPYNNNNAGPNTGYVLVGPSIATAKWQADVPFERHDPANPMTPKSTQFHPTLALKDEPTLPNNRLHAEVPQTTPLRTAGMTKGIADPADPDPAYQPTVVLQRLAIPYMPAQPDPTKAGYNPYVTVDYIEPQLNPNTGQYVSGLRLNDAVLYDANAKRDGQMGREERQPLTQRAAYGRRQPFRATGVTAQNPNPAALEWPRHTFFRQNGQGADPTQAGNTLDLPFDWYAHLDRQASSVIELLNVSAYKPHELTQMFVATPGPQAPVANEKFRHLAPWFDYDQLAQAAGQPLERHSRLYRALGMLGLRDRTAGVPFGGRVAGKVNINAIWDVETFRAVCDAVAQTISGNHIDPALVDQVWQQLLQQRSPMGYPRPVGDNPFWDFTVPNPGIPGQPNSLPVPDTQYPPTDRGLNKTLLRDGPGAQTPLLQVPPGGQVPQHPYVQNELMSKVLSHFTTRSNTFAVYVTTGFFLVRDWQAPQANQYPDRPPLLGAELDVTLRHKFFAIVDRTNLSLDPTDPTKQGPRPIYFPYEPMQGQVPAEASYPPNPVDAFVPAYKVGPNGGLVVRDTIDHFGSEYSDSSGELFEIRPGTRLYVDTGRDAEVVTVTKVNVATSTITFTPGKRHHRGCAVCTQQIGNPGPQPLPINYESPPYANTIVPYRLVIH